MSAVQMAWGHASGRHVCLLFGRWDHRNASSTADFWSRYLQQVATKHPEWQGVGTSDGRNWLYQSSPIKDCRIAPGFKGDGRISHELVIMARDPARNAELFDAIQDRKGRFEETYGLERPLVWDTRGTAKRYLIGEYAYGSIEREVEADDYIVWFMDCGERLRAAVGVLPANL
jgi:hypothetical protein